MGRAAAAVLTLALCACDEAPKRQVAPGAASPRHAEAIRTAEERLRARLRLEGEMRTRAIAVHRQALADTIAVCGQVNPTGRGEDPFLPWVAVIAFEGERADRVEFHLAASGTEATRVYFEMVDRCWDGGGPTSARSIGRPLPPAPTDTPVAIPNLAPERPPPALPGQTPPASPDGARPTAATPAGSIGSVTMSQRTPVNLRSHPSGGGEVLRTLPRGSTVNVFGEAPGGWLQVGDREPWGWIHNSLVER